MKNVNGLAEAMRLVESACEKGEITIIGHGNLPTAKELLGKCVLYINKMYGVDVLADVVKDLVATRESEDICISCSGCSGCAEDGIADEDESEKIIVVNLGDIEDIVDMIIRDNMGYLNEGLIENIVKSVKSYYESIDEIFADAYDIDNAVDGVYDALCDCIEVTDFDEDYIDDVVSKIVRKVDEKCISVENI